MAYYAVLWEGERALCVVDSTIQFGQQGVIYSGKKTKKSIQSPGKKALMVSYAAMLETFTQVIHTTCTNNERIKW